MSESLEFDVSHHYKTLASGITVPIEISFGGTDIRFEAKIDTGSQFCIFQRKQGERLGIDVESGMPLRVLTATGGFMTYGHAVRLSVLGIEAESTVYFSEDEAFYLNLLGRQGWLDRVVLGLVDYEGKLLLSDYGGEK